MVFVFSGWLILVVFGKRVVMFEKCSHFLKNVVLKSIDRDRELRIWNEREARRHECETRGR